MESKIKAGDVFKTNQGCTCTVILYKNQTSILIEFNDKHKHRAVVRSKHLQSGYVKNPYHPSVRGRGFLGVGKFSAYCNGKVTDEYKKWSSMFRRCYSEVDAKDRSHYSDCEIHEDWFNFQNFASWLANNKSYQPDYHLDKDLIFLGNRVYSPKACCLVPIEINNLFLDPKSKSRNLPLGVKADSRSGRFIASMRMDSKNKHIGSFDTPQDAHQAYVVAKESYAKEVANKWRGHIDERVYDALMNWRVTQ